RSHTQRRVSTRLRREITKHGACTYRRGTSPIPRGHAMVNSPPLGLFVAGRLRPRCLELADDRNGVLRRWPDGVVGVDICRPDPSVLVDDVTGRHRQPKVGLVVKLVERVAEHRVEFLWLWCR